MNTLISFLKKWASICPEHLAVTDEKITFTYKELRQVVAKLQKAYLKVGISKGDIVGVAHINGCFLVANYLALFGLGVSVIPFPDEGEVQEYLKIFEEIVPKCVIYSKSTSVICEGVRKKISFQDNEKIVNYVVEGKEIYEKIRKVNTSENIVFKYIPLAMSKSDSDLYDLEGGNQYWNITSGSTGRIKIANVSTSKIVLNAIASNRCFPLTLEDNYCCMFSTGMHPHELFTRPLVAGSGNVLLRSNSVVRLDRYIAEKRITQIVAVPAIYKTLLQMTLKKENWKNIKYLLSGGEVTNYYIRKKFYEVTGKKITPVWGSTETSGLTFFVPEELLLQEDNYIGIHLPEYQVRIDEKTGRLQIKGLACFDGYCNVDNARYFTEDGYYISDDLVICNECGVYQYQGRIDDIVKIKGKKRNLSLLKKELGKLDGVVCIEVICTEIENERVLGIFCVMRGEKRISQAMINKQINGDIPYKLMYLKTMPLLPSKKTDRKKLELMLRNAFK